MLNPSADSAASTDSGRCDGIPLSLLVRSIPIGRGAKALNPGGPGAKPPLSFAGTQASF